MRFHSLKRGSFERFLIDLAAKAGHNFEFVFVFSEEPPLWLKESLNLNRAKIDWINTKMSRQSLKDIDTLMERYRPDIVHMHFFGLLTPFIPYIRWRHRRKLLVHIHAVTTYCSGRSKLETWLIPLRKRLCVKSIDRAISVSDFVRDKTMREFGFDEKQLITIYNGIGNTDPQGSEDSDLRSELSISKNTSLILTAAWLNKIKGIHVLIESLPRVLKSTDKKVVVIIAGEGPEKALLQNLARSLNLHDHVFFLGWRNDLLDLIRQSDMVIVPSICEEALSYFVLEAMAEGKPIIASHAGGIPELLGGSPSAGLLVPPGDKDQLAGAILSVLKNHGKTQLFSLEAQKRSQGKFHILMQIDSMIKIYSEVLSRSF
jgi:glycosyltransferase involved in cell wall biosynthesis